MRNLVTLIALCLAQVCLAPFCAAQNWEDRRRFGPDSGAATLRILSSTDTSFFAPIIEDFIAARPGVSVEYLVTGTADLDRRFRAAPADFDVVISSAMDLQVRLTNDGYARRINAIATPDWAQWRQSLYAFTSEPAAIVLSTKAFGGAPIPRTRQELIAAMRADPEAFRGKTATYDVRQSGLGYLFATQDARASETFWRLMEVLGGLDVKLYCCSGEMIDDLVSGEILVAYNVLGSYAAARLAGRDAFRIVLPSDFPTTMMRTALVSDTAPNAARGADFVAYLVARQARPEAGQSLPSLSARTAEVERATIALEPALLTFLDALKRRKFLAEWEDAVIQD